MLKVLTPKMVRKMTHKMNKWRVRCAVLCASVRTFFGCDITSNILRRDRFQTNSFGAIRTVDDYAAADAHIEHVMSRFGHNSADNEFTARQERLVDESAHAIRKLHGRLIAAYVSPDFQKHCFQTLATSTDVGHVPDVDPADLVVFEVIGKDYITTLCAYLCVRMSQRAAVADTDPRLVVKTPRWVYEALQQLLVREEDALPTELSIELLPLCAKLDRCSPVPSSVEMKAASDLWQDAGSDSPFYVFSSALDAAKLLV